MLDFGFNPSDSAQTSKLVEAWKQCRWEGGKKALALKKDSGNNP